ncbi:hypothetical protein A6A04_06530 [Paramagnetospirillum marisnigri]|uniref:Lipoprotein n=2 Tax=Paramagnetospirillum marisnigri TaxID=1285242 RepID=A0A178MFC1_9PROT|nr:hypothetical protein A6A04_06530 [Paramagnetospirillum marisnigri]
MKTMFKLIAGLGLITIVAACTAQAADPTPAQSWTPGWRHEQMVKAMQDGTFTPGQGFGPGYGRGQGPGYGRGMGGPGFAAAIGPDGKIDPDKLPVGCPMRQAAAK